MRVEAMVATVLLVGLGAVSAPSPLAYAQGPVDAQSAALSVSASCSQGDIEVTYAGEGLERQWTRFTEESGTDLHSYDVNVYSPSHRGLEYILSQTDQPPPPGTVVAVHVSIGESPPNRATTGEFFVVYRCDTLPNDQGGNNVVLDTCVGPYGSCPLTAAEWSGRIPVREPRFTG